MFVVCDFVRFVVCFADCMPACLVGLRVCSFSELLALYWHVN